MLGLLIFAFHRGQLYSGEGSGWQLQRDAWWWSADRCDRVGHRERFKLAMAKLSKKSQKPYRRHFAIRVFGARAPTVRHATDPTLAPVQSCAGQARLQAFRPAH